MIETTLATLRRWRDERALPPAAKAALARDRAGPPAADPGPERVIGLGLAWLARAQDRSATADGGVARHHDLRTGWGPSYPETTGYIVPTLLAEARHRGDPALRERARRMLDWLVAIQFPDGGFQGGTVDQTPKVPVTFNTGQILLGLAAGTATFGDVYRPALRKAADWLASTQDADGKWSRHPTPFARPGLKTYETHVAWGLIEAERVEPGRGWGEAALRQVRWAMGQMGPGGWPEHCCLDDAARPLAHTLGYHLRGLLEAWRLARDAAVLDAARRLGAGLRQALGADGRLPGRLGPGWQGAVDWVCLTGSAQIAHGWLMLHEDTGEPGWREAAEAALRFVRRTVRVEGDPDLVGGVAGSFPIDGAYGRFQHLNWAAKFTIDACRLELDVAARAGTAGA